MTKAVIKIWQGSSLAQTKQGGLIIPGGAKKNVPNIRRCYTPVDYGIGGLLHECVYSKSIRDLEEFN